MEPMKRILIRTLPVLIFTIMSCSKDMNVSSADIVTLIDNGLYVSKTDTVIKSTDAVKVANLFSFNGTEATKGNFSKSVKSVNEFKDSESELGVYVVNYEGGGWVLVSSTKKHYPILAYSDKGIFCTDTLNGVSQYLNSYKREINRKHKLPVSDVKSEMEAWKVYEEKNMPGYYMTKDSDPITSLIGESVIQWSNEGYDVYPITEDEIDGLPANVLAEFKALAAAAEDYGEEYHNTSFILKKSEANQPNYNNYMLSTEWHQTGVYNDQLDGDYPLGCGTVAIGQILWYHGKYSDWSWVGKITNIDSIGVFLKNIRDRIVTNSQTGQTNAYQIKSMLRSEDYDFLDATPSNTNVPYVLSNYGPIFMHGQSSSSGHAWVCDGSTSYNSYRIYKLMTISIFGELEYVENTNYRSSTMNHNYFHMNWGWDGDYNGWYTDNSSMEGYDNSRGNIINIKPNDD